MLTKLGEKFTDLFRRYMPDAFVFALLLTLMVGGFAYLKMDVGIAAVIEGWYEGFWTLLKFGMQMTLLVITGYSIALSPIAKKVIDQLAKRIKTPNQVYFFVVFIGTLLCMVSWGWVIITAVLARELAMRIKGLNYPFLVACVYFSFSGWVTGLSSTIPLLLNTEKNYLIEGEILTGTISTATTLGSSLNIAMICLFLIGTPIMMMLLAPKNKKFKNLQDSLIQENDSVDITIKEEAKSFQSEDKTLSDTLNNSTIIQWLIGIMGLCAIVLYFNKMGFNLNLDIMIFIFLILGLILHQTPMRYSLAMKRSSMNISGILFQFPFYAGIMGIIKYTGLGASIATWLASVATVDNYPLYAFFSGAAVNFAIPSAGGEFAVIGPSILDAVQQLGFGLSADVVEDMISRASMSMAYGESLTNALQPFFLLLILPIMGAGTRIQARDVMGYLVVPFLVFFIIQAFMVVYWPM